MVNDYLGQLLADAVTNVDGQGNVRIGDYTVGHIAHYTGGDWYATDTTGTAIPGTHPTRLAAVGALLAWNTSKWDKP